MKSQKLLNVHLDKKLFYFWEQKKIITYFSCLLKFVGWYYYIIISKDVPTQCLNHYDNYYGRQQTTAIV